MSRQATELSNQPFYPGRDFRRHNPELANWLESHIGMAAEPGAADVARAIRRGWKTAAAAPLLTVEEIEKALGIDLSSQPPEGPRAST